MKLQSTSGAFVLTELLNKKNEQMHPWGGINKVRFDYT
jgi:hypothetical protein